MSPVTGPASQSGSFLVVTGEECTLLREVAQKYLGETTWALSYEALDETDERMLAAIKARRIVCERVVA